MIPIGDQNPTHRRPWVNYILLVSNVLVFLWQSQHPAPQMLVVASYGVVPARLFGDIPGEAFTVLTGMFMHGGLGHLAGNMLFLYIFGDNIEDALGRHRYLLFYLASGLIATFAQIVIEPSGHTPMVGASGAIAGVLGGYMILFPRAPITVLVGFFFLVLPAWVVMGMWFLWNLISGVGSLVPGANVGVAFFAHLGGFVAGLMMIRPFLGNRPLPGRREFSGFRPPSSRNPWSRGPRGPRPPWQ